MFNPFRLFQKIWSGSSTARTARLTSRVPELPTTQTSSTTATAVNPPYQILPLSSSFSTPFGYHQDSIFRNIGHESRPIPNIASPQVFMFSANKTGASPTQLPPSVHTVNVNMADASFIYTPPTPPTSPPTSPENAPRAHINTDTNEAKKATVEGENNEGLRNGTASTSSPADERPKLQAKHPQQCHRKSQQAEEKNDINSHYVWEEFPDPNDPMPKGYAGTVGSIRMTRELCSGYNACDAHGGHVLVCGHWVLAEEPCGANCRTEGYAQQPFCCTQCRDIIMDVYNNKVTDAEKARIAFAQTQNDSMYIALCVEYVTRYIPAAAGNITQTIISMLSLNQTGRSCLPMPWMQEDDSVEARHAEFCTTKARVERKLREARTVMDPGPLNTHEKRKEHDVSDHQGGHIDTRDEVHGGASHSASTQNPSTVPPTPTNSNKRHKAKLQTHPEPITEASRGTKRFTLEDLFKRPDDLKPRSPSSSFSANHSAKKMKLKLETHRDPITDKTRGTKRNLSFSDDEIMSTKRFMESKPPNSGDAIFATPPPNVVGPLLRKRQPVEHFIEAAEAELYKRARTGYPMWFA